MQTVKRQIPSSVSMCTVNRKIPVKASVQAINNSEDVLTTKIESRHLMEDGRSRALNILAPRNLFSCLTVVTFSLHFTYWESSINFIVMSDHMSSCRNFTS